MVLLARRDAADAASITTVEGQHKRIFRTNAQQTDVCMANGNLTEVAGSQS